MAAAAGAAAGCPVAVSAVDAAAKPPVAPAVAPVVALLVAAAVAQAGCAEIYCCVCRKGRKRASLLLCGRVNSIDVAPVVDLFLAARVAAFGFQCQFGTIKEPAGRRSQTKRECAGRQLQMPIYTGGQTGKKNYSKKYNKSK